MTPGKYNQPKLLANHPAVLMGTGAGSKFKMPKFPYIQEIHKRAEAMTPVLKEILSFRPPPRWDR